MPNTTTVTKKLEIVDLIRERKQFDLLDVPKVPVTVTIEVTTSALIGKPTPAPSAKMQRLEDAARKKLEEYEDIITSECGKFNKKIGDLLDQGKLKEAIAMAETVNVSVKNALKSAEGAAVKAVEDAKAKEAQGDKLLKEARVKTAVKITFAGVSLATNAAKLAATQGADVTAYISIAKTLLDLGLEINQQLKDEPKLRRDVIDGVRSYMELRETVVMQAAKRSGLTDTSSLPGFPQIIPAMAQRIVKTGKELTKGKDAGQIAKNILSITISGVKSQFNDVEKARQMYRNHTVKMRHKVDGVSEKADKLMAEMKKATTLKEGVKIGAACMQVKGKVRTLANALAEAQQFLADNEVMMKGLGLECDDRTCIQKIMALDKATIFTEGADLVSNIKAVYNLFQAVKTAVA